MEGGGGWRRAPTGWRRCADGAAPYTCCFFFRGQAAADGVRPPPPVAVWGSPHLAGFASCELPGPCQGEGARHRRRRPSGHTNIYFPSPLPTGAPLPPTSPTLPPPPAVHADDVAGPCWGRAAPAPADESRSRPSRRLARATAVRLVCGHLARVDVAAGCPSHRPPARRPAHRPTGPAAHPPARPSAHLATPPPTTSRCLAWW